MKFTFEKSQALTYKYRALYWMRLKQRCVLIATEAGQNNADVLGCNEEKSYEVEVKVSWADYLAEFTKHKHYQYAGISDGTWYDQWVPQYFYFAVPAELVERVKAHLEASGKAARHKNYTNYGVICADTWTVMRRAKRMHTRPPSQRFKTTLALRMGSELIRMHEAWL